MRKRKKPKMNFFFFDKKHKKENSTAPQKAIMEVEIWRGNKPCDLKGEKNLKMNFFLTRKIPQHWKKQM